LCCTAHPIQAGKSQKPVPLSRGHRCDQAHSFPRLDQTDETMILDPQTIDGIYFLKLDLDGWYGHRGIVLLPRVIPDF
jgi:hypothetical protein